MPLLQTVTDMPEEALHGDLRRLQAAEFLYETSALTAPVYTFTHVLTQEVAYHSLVRRARQQYHTRIAQVLEAQFPEVAERQPEFLAHHCTEAGLNAQAIGYWQQAGQLALERSAHIEAISHFTQGLALLKRLPDSAERVQQELTLQLAIGSPLLMLKGHTAPEVAYAYTRAYELAQQLGETPQRFSVLAGLWRFYLSQASLHAAQELAEQCFSLAQRFGVSTALQEAHQIVGSTCFFMGDPGAAQTHLEQATALYDPSRSRTLALSRGTDPGVVSLSRLAWALWWRGYPDRALAKSLEAIALAQSLSHLYSLIFALQYHAHLHVYRREAAQARERFEAVMRLMREHGFVQFWRGGMTRLGWILVEQGAIDEGIAQILQGLDAERMHGMPLTRCSDLVILAQAYVKAGECQKGLQVVAEALEIVRHNAIRHYEPELYRLKGELVLQADGHGLAGYSAPLSATWDPSPGAEAEACLQQAIARAGQQGAKSLELRAVLSLSRLWQRQGKRDEARALLAPIYGWFTEGFDTADLQEAKALLEKLGR